MTTLSAAQAPTLSRSPAGAASWLLRARWVQPAADVCAVALAAWVVGLVGPALDASVVLLLVPTWILLLTWTHAYRGGSGLAALTASSSSAREVLRAGCALGLGCWVLTALDAAPVASQQLLLTTGVLVAGSIAHRVVGSHLASRAAGRRHPLRVVAVGQPAELGPVLAELNRAHDGRVEITVCVPAAATPGADLEDPAPVGFEDVEHAIREAAAQAVITLPSSSLGPRDIQRLGWTVDKLGAQMYVATGVEDLALSRTRLERVGSLRMLHVRPAVIRGPQHWLKGAWERLAAAALLVMIMPLLVVIAVLVRVESPGGAIFRQVRVGRDSMPFTMYKFRTMRSDAEQLKSDLAQENEADGALFKIRADPRITRLGSFLRKYSLDELPQLVNVLLGQMSLVGPRPALPHEVDAYGYDPMRRLVAKPGLTGLWQVSGRSDLSWDESVRMDLTYVDNWSMAADLSILARTVRAVLSHRGAY